MKVDVQMTRGQCQNCGAPLAEDARGGLCVRCLFAAAHAPLPSGDASPSACFPGPGGQPQSNPTDAPALPRRFGDYELLEEIARGGMGVVFKARQISLDRIVAVKLLLGGALSSPEFVKRFRLEAAAAGGLQHPNIVAIHEVGLHVGQHFIAMDFVDGPNLATVLAHGPLPARRAVGYLKTVAEAIEYAHSKGILHRDLKPSNILLDSNDQPRVTDFGLAKKFESDVDLTVTGQVLGSPNYMPPEQASGHRGNLNRTADVYSLGAILYHLVTGRPPFQAATVATTLEQVRTTDPITPRRLNASLPRDLETICLKCLEKEPARRYATAQALADELDRFLKSEPIQARPIGTLGKTWRWCRRKPALATVGAVAALLLLTLAIGGPIVASQQRALAENNRQLSYASSLTAAWQAWDIGNIDRCLGLLQQQQPGPGQTDLREFTWGYLWNLCRPARETPAVTNSVPVFIVAASPDGTHIAVMGVRGTVTLWNAATRETERQFSTEQTYDGGLAFSPNGRLLVSTGNIPGFYGGRLQVWNASTGARLHQADFGGCPGEFSPDGRWFAFGVAKEVVILDAEHDWKVDRRWTAHSDEVWEVRWSPDGTRLVTASPDHTARVWDSATGAALGTLTGHSLRVSNAAFSPDGHIIATASEDKTVRLWSATNFLQLEGQGYQHAVEVAGLAFSKDGRWLATASDDGLVKLSDLNTKLLRTLRGHSRQVKSLQFALHDTALVTGSGDGKIRFWDLTRLPPNDMLEGLAEDGVRSPVAFSPDNRTLATVSSIGTQVLRWDLATGTVRGTLPMPTPSVADLIPPDELESAASATIANTAINDLAFAADGFLAVAHMFDVRLKDSDSWRPRIELYDFDHNVFVDAMLADEPIQFSPDGKRLIMQALRGGAVEMRDRTGHLEWTELGNDPPPGRGNVAALAFSPNGKRVAAVGMQPAGYRELVLLDATSGKRLKVLQTEGTQAPIGAMAFTPDSAYLITGGFYTKIQVWDVGDGELAYELDGHSSHIRSLAVSPDGRTLATGDQTGLLKLWSLERRVELLTLRAHERSIASLHFSPDGKTLASGSQEGIVRLWRADPER